MSFKLFYYHFSLVAAVACSLLSDTKPTGIFQKRFPINFVIMMDDQLVQVWPKILEAQKKENGKENIAGGPYTILWAFLALRSYAAVIMVVVSLLSDWNGLNFPKHFDVFVRSGLRRNKQFDDKHFLLRWNQGSTQFKLLKIEHLPNNWSRFEVARIKHKSWRLIFHEWLSKKLFSSLLGACTIKLYGPKIKHLFQ